MASSFDLDIKGLAEGLVKTESKMDVAVLGYAKNKALVLQNYARQKAPWQNQTGHARQRLTGSAFKATNGYKIQLAHGVDYGIWLELAHEKRFAIIQPTILAKSNDIMKGFEKLMERFK